MKPTLPTFLSALGSKLTSFKNLSCLLVVLLFSGGAWGQVTVTNPSNTTPAMSASYTTLALAIADVNNRTAISGPVTITLNASSPQTAPAGGYTLTNVAITGSSDTNRFIFDGGGNTITAFTPQTSGNLNDAIFKIIGADFITIQNFTMQENSANTTTAAGTNNMTEFGVALFYASTTNGAQNNIIQNNTISLNRTYTNTFGIYSNTSHSATAMTTTAQVTATGGANSFNKVYGNSISNVNYGTVFIGSGALTAVAGQDNGTDIGGSSSATGNTYTNWGGIGVAPSSYVGLTGNNYCIFVNNTYNDNISYNSITSASGAAQTGTIVLGGILKNYSTGTTAQPTGTITTTINNNTVTLTNTPASLATGSVIGINNQGLSPLLSTATVNMNNNIVQNCVNGGANMSSGGFTGITNLSLPGTLNMNNNSVINNAITGATATSGSLTAISNTGAAGTVNINNNIVRGLASSTTSGQIVGIVNSGAVVTALNINNNSLGNSTSGFFTTSTATSGSLFGISSSGGATTCALTIQNNDIRGITYSVAASAAQTYIQNSATTLSQNISNNTFTNLNVNTTGNVTFISNSVSAPSAGSKTINGNSIVTAFNKSGAGGTISLYNDGGSSTCTTPIQNNNNNFSNITVTGATTITGWFNNDGTGSTPQKTITGNTFNNWTCGSNAVNALQVNYGGTTNVSNNTITNITGTGAITGYLHGSNGTITTLTIASNIITGLSSTGTGGGVTGISNSSTATTTNINSNTINTISSSSTTATVAGITTSASANIYQNTINTLSCVGTTSGVTNGIMVTGGTTVNIYRNKIYDLATTGAFTTTPGVNGIVLSAGTTVNTYNNIIGDLKAASATSSDAIRGISITSSTASTSYNVYNNSLYLTGSGGTGFGTSGIYHTVNATTSTAKLDLQNNMIFNTCTPNGTGLTVAYRRSAGAASNLANYASTSNKNLFYAGTPGSNNLIYSDGTSSAQTMSAYQSGVFTAGTIATRDANSFTETSFDPATYFVSTTGSNANYLQPASGITTQAEGGGNTIALCSPDYNGVTRPGFSGAAYDVGAWEFAGISPAPVLTSMSPSPALTAQCTKTARTISINISSASGTITGATLNYSHNGTAQTAVSMTNSSGSTWTGTMLAPSTGNATVTWSITATNSLGLSTLYTGTSYSDEPNTGITATVSASPSSVCDGSTSSLSLSYTGAGSKVISSALTATTAASYSNPIYSNWANNRSQILILGSELSASGIMAGNLNSMSFPLTSTSTTSRTSYTIKIGATTTSSLTTTSFLTPTFTTVYSANYTPVVGANTFLFSTPFVWDGTSNIVIETCWDNTASTSTENSTATAQTTSFNSVISYNRSTTTGTSICGAANTPVTAYTNRPLITFTGSNVQISPTVSAYSWSDGSTTLGTTNPLSVTVTGAPTYTATATVNSCPITATVTPTVLPLPNAPTGTNSSQCGNGVPTASVADNNSYTTPTFKWYAAATGGTALQSSTSTTYTTSINTTTTFYVAVVGANGCESSRTAVTVTVTQPDAISATTSASSICLGQSFTLTAANTATTPTQNYSYSWVCSTTGSGATTANTNNPASVTPTAAGSYTYTVTGTDGACSVINTVAVTVNALPTISSATATPSPVCSGAAITLTANSLGSPLSLAVGNNSGTAISTTGTPYRTGTSVGNQIWNQYLILASELTAAGITRSNINSLGINVSTTSPTGTMTSFSIGMANVSDTALTSTMLTNTLSSVYSVASYSPISGINTHLFSTPFLWDGTSNLLIDIKGVLGTAGTGTALITSTTPGGIIATVQTNSATGFSTTTGTTLSNQRPQFTLGYQSNQTSNFSWSWNSTPAIATATGTTTETNTGSSAITKTYTVTATNATTGCTNTATTSAVTINPVTVAPTATNSTQCGSGIPTASVTGTGTSGNTFKWYSAATGGTLLQNSASTTYTTSISTTTTFYVCEFNGTCESARTAVTVTVNTPPTISASASLGTVCSGSPTVLSVTSSNSGYTYSWDNSLGTGASVTASPTATTTYTVTATDNSGGANNGCATTATVAVTVNSVPSAITFNPSSATICNGSTQSIVANGGSESATPTAPITSSATSSSAGANPLYTLYGAAKTQIIYTASELSAAGLTTGSTISSIALNITAVGENRTALNIGYSYTTATTTTTTFFTNITNVYSAPLSPVLNLNTYTFNSPTAAWNGTDNIIFEFCFSDNVVGSTSSTVTTVASTTGNTVISAALDSTTSECSVTTGTKSKTRPYIVLGYNKPTTFSWNNTNSLYTDTGATTAYTGNPTTVYAKPTSTTTYTATATGSNGCTSSNSVTINVTPTNTVGTASSTPTLCISTALTAITHTTTGATGIGTATGLPAGVSAAWASNTITISGTPTASGTFNYSIPLTGGCGSVNATGTITVNAQPTALVLTGSLACTGATGSITSSTSVSGVNYQLYDSSNATVGSAVSGTGSGLTWSSLPIATGYYVKATNATTSCVSSNSNTVAVGTVTDKTWLGTTNNSWSTASNWSCGSVPSSSDVVVINSGNPVLDTNFTVGATGSLTLSGTGTLTINPTSTLTVAGTANFGGKAVTIKSDATGNGAIGQVTGTLSGATNVTVERYIPAKRSWRAITAPVTMTTSINANWQEGGTGNATNGFDIWDPNGGTGIITGGISSSLLEYSSSANTWTGITNTTASSSMMSGLVNKPFMAFVTGPYGANNVSSGATATTLRATGTLITGDKTYATTATKYTFIGNPYASPLDLTAMLNSASNASSSFGGNVWVWDANVLGTYSVGSYNLFDFAATNYSNTTNNATISGTQIQSGQAFFVKSTDGASFTIKEAHKGSAFSNAVFRTATPEILRVGLYKQVNNEWSGRDGAMEVLFSEAEINQAPNKMANGSENIAFVKNGSLFASEHHLPLLASDVLNIRVWKTTAGNNYKLKINTENFVTTNLAATLEDLYTNSRTPLTLDGSAVEYPFTVTTDALSSGDRFRIVFQSSALGMNNPTATSFSIIPNPVTGDAFQVNLGSLATGTYTYSIFNAIGQEIEKGSINNAVQNTNYTVKFRESAATGVYIMKIKGSDNSVYTAKIIKK